MDTKKDTRTTPEAVDLSSGALFGFYNMKPVYVDHTWHNSRESIGFNGCDLACYVGDGLSVWPCGLTSDDGDDEMDCHCVLCNAVRAILPNKQI